MLGETAKLGALHESERAAAVTVSAGVAERRIVRGKGYQGVQKVKIRRSGGGARGNEDIGMRERGRSEREGEDNSEPGLLSRRVMNEATRQRQPKTR